MRATAHRRERFESILLAYVRAVGPELVLPPDLLARICAEVPGTTAEEIRAAVRWSLQRSKRKEAAIERVMLRKRDAMGDNIIQLNERIEQIERGR